MFKSLKNFLLKWHLIRAISAEEATRFAREECAKRNVTWDEPILVLEQLGYYEITTNAGCFGANCPVTVDWTDGRILHFGICPR